MSSFEAMELINNISQVLEISTEICHAMAEEIQSGEIPYKKLYDEYQSGGWYTATLYAPGEIHDGDLIRDGISGPTQLASCLPITQRFLEELGLRFFMVRIARMEPDSCLWEHRDYIELDKDKERLRLHVPLITNPKAVIHFPGWSVHMATGWIWKLDPTVSHAASNSGTNVRIHLLLDCYMDNTLSKMLSLEKLGDQYLLQQLKLGDEQRKKILEQAHDIFRQQGSDKAEQHLLKLFHQFDLCHETSYDLLIDFYSVMGFTPREKYWIQEQITRIHDREKMEPHKTNTEVCTMLHATPQAFSSNLPQIRILEQILATFRRCPGFEKAFLRGSLALGNADFHSDIDLFCEISPLNFAAFIKEADRSIKNDHNAIANGLIDPIVKDFGGIGYIYLLEAEEGIYQLDLYIVCQGTPWNSEAYRQEIFCRVHREIDAKKHKSLLYRLHSADIDYQIQCLRNVEPSVSQMLVQLNVLGVMLKKCLERGDHFVASNEYNIWRTCFVKMIRQKFDVQYRDHGFYHIKRLAVEADNGSSLFEDLLAMFTSPLTSENFIQVHHYAMYFAQKHYPEDYARQRRLIDAVSHHIGGPQSQAVPTEPIHDLRNTLHQSHSA